MVRSASQNGNGRTYHQQEKGPKSKRKNSDAQAALQMLTVLADQKPGSPQAIPSTPSSPSTKPVAVETVEGVEGRTKKPQYHWPMEAGLDHNFRRVGRLLASLKLELYQHPDGGLVLVEGGRVRRISSAKEFAPFLIDHIRISVFKKDKYHGEKVADSVLNNMLLSRSFLNNFQLVEEVVTTPIVLPDFTPSCQQRS